MGGSLRGDKEGHQKGWKLLENDNNTERSANEGRMGATPTLKGMSKLGAKTGRGWKGC